MVKKKIKEMYCECDDIIITFIGPSLLKKCRCKEAGYKKKDRIEIDIDKIHLSKK